MQTLGNFEKLAQAYQGGRRGFDKAVFDFLAQQTQGLAGMRILDIGCGTGIATRQLAQRGAEVIGSDISGEMIAQARQGGGIEYVVAPAHEIPFEDQNFDLVTAFSAFHWFANLDAVSEIRRVLKSGGLFAVINKNDVAGIRKDVNQLFDKYRSAKGAKHEYRPEKILEESGFEDITTHTIAGTEIFTHQEAITYLQSIALWNLVPEDEREEMVAAVVSFCDDVLRREGVLKRELETVVVVGVKHQ